MTDSSNSNNIQGQINNMKTKFNFLFNFYGISNGIFPIKEDNNTLLEKKRKSSFKQIEEIDENDPKKSNTNDGQNINTTEGKMVKLNYYDDYSDKKEIKLNEIDDSENKGDIIEEINLEENDKIEEVTDYKNLNENEIEIYTDNDEKSDNFKESKKTKKRKRKTKKKNDEEDLSYSMSKSSSKIISESVSLSSSITPIKQRSNNNNNHKSKKSKIVKDDNLMDISSENNENNIDPLTAKDLFNNPHDALPDFLKPEKIRDKNGNRPDSAEYDCNTLYIPSDYLKTQTDAMLQFWEYKREHFDKIIFFKVGRFYEMFYDDAIICNQLLDLKFMGDDPKKLYVAFPEIALESKGAILVQAGFKIAIIEQMETPKELKERLKSDKNGEKAVKRKLCNVLTKGTYYKKEDDIINNSIDNKNNIYINNSKNKFCISIFQMPNKLTWGICIFDVTTLQFYLGKIEEDQPKFLPKTQTSQKNESNYIKMKSLLYNISPEEIICVNKNIPETMLNFIKGLSSRPLINNIKNNYKYSELNDLCIKYFGNDFEKWSPLIISLFANHEEKYPTCVAFYLSIIYLEKIFLAKNTIPIANFNEYCGNVLNPKKRMILDYDVITNLELLESRYDPRNKEAGSFIEYFNKAVSPFGRRLLKNWILNPLYDIKEINDRLDIIEDLINNDIVITSFREKLSKWNDIERQSNRFFKLVLENNDINNNANNINQNKMRDFFKLINFLSDCQKIFDIFNEYILSKKFKSENLIKKVTIGGGVPNLSDSIKNILNNFQIIETQDEKGNSISQIIAKPGKYKEYDKLIEKFNEIKKKFSEILTKERLRLKCGIINYAHTKNIRFELEVPENVVKDNRPKEYILTTSKKGFMRFHTKEIIDNVNKLEEVEEKIKIFTSKLNSEILKIFYGQKNIITSFINSVAEIDCLTSLAFVCIIDKEKFSRPKFITLEENNGIPYLELIECIHPCLLDRVPYFVPNDIYLGKDNKTTIVITGPNMGGKSTLLRQVCISTIIAQIGCFVPAKKCVMTLVDRIFTRIGANDKLLEGKSTFFIEMEETKNILEHATKNSLIIMDELGRGTSTKDGQIIAKTILYQIVHKNQSRCLFTTHYHDIIEWCQKEENIRLSFMEAKIDNVTKDIHFEYKFKDGISPDSCGLEVAKLVGLPQKVLNVANDIKINNKLAIQ